MKWPHDRGRERGVALITALLIVSIAAITGVALAARQRLDIRQTANILDRDRAYMVALGGEYWARQVLSRDGREGSIDTLGDIWASKPPAITVEGGKVWGRVYDLQGRFNLNNLVRDGRHSLLDVGRFERLLEQLDLDVNLAHAVADWIDPDDVIGGPGGAEDETYLSRYPAFQTADQPLRSVTELMAVEGFNADSVAKLTPFVAALPSRTLININTAPLEVLISLAPDITMDNARELDLITQAAGFASVAEFLNHPAVKGKQGLEPGLAVASNFFLVTVRARIGRGHMRLFTLLSRSRDRVRVVRRSQGFF